ncbi:MAG: SufE family protein [Chitinophagales bacterium]
MSNFSAIEKEIIEDFELFDDPMDKYEHIIDQGNELEVLEEKYKIDENLVKGCQSKVWLVAAKEGDIVFFKADSNTVITKGVVSILIKVLSGKKPQEIIDYKLDILEKIGLKEMLSSQRANGLQSMINLMKQYAHKFQ